MSRSRGLLLAAGLLCASRPGVARAGDPVPTVLQNIDVVEKLGAAVPLDLAFTDWRGVKVKLGDSFRHGRPVILTLVYYECPMLCSLVLSGLADALKRAGHRPGDDVDLVTISFDPKETPKLAAAKRRNYLQSVGTDERTPVWPFLTGTQEAIRAITEAVGFKYNYVPSVNQFAHTAVLFVLTPEGTISRYLYGVTFREQDLRLALAEANAGRAGISFDRILLSCFRYNPATRRYHVFVAGFLQVGALLVFFALATLLCVCWRAELRASRREAGATVIRIGPFGPIGGGRA